MTSFVLTRPATTQPLDIATSREIIVPAGQVENVDELPVSYLSVKWILTIYNEIENKSYSAEILANHRFGNNVIYQRYSIMGDNIDYNMNVLINAGFLILQITNNELYDFNISITQIRTS